MQWRARSSQQCVVDVGITGAGPHTLWIRSENVRNKNEVGAWQVVVYGIYEQQIRTITTAPFKVA